MNFSQLGGFDDRSPYYILIVVLYEFAIDISLLHCRKVMGLVMMLDREYSIPGLQAGGVASVLPLDGGGKLAKLGDHK